MMVDVLRAWQPVEVKMVNGVVSVGAVVEFAMVNEVVIVKMGMLRAIGKCLGHRAQPFGFAHVAMLMMMMDKGSMKLQKVGVIVSVCVVLWVIESCAVV